jgi:hypothetical protein
MSLDVSVFHSFKSLEVGFTCHVIYVQVTSKEGYEKSTQKHQNKY